MAYLESPLRTAADNDTGIPMGNLTGIPWTQISVRVFDQNGDPVEGNTAGTLTGFVIVGNTQNYLQFDQPIDFSIGEFHWEPELAPAKEFRFEVAGLPAGFSYQVYFHKWEG